MKISRIDLIGLNGATAEHYDKVPEVNGFDDWLKKLSLCLKGYDYVLTATDDRYSLVITGEDNIPKYFTWDKERQSLDFIITEVMARIRLKESA